jgi:hypothetical protein
VDVSRLSACGHNSLTRIVYTSNSIHGAQVVTIWSTRASHFPWLTRASDKITNLHTRANGFVFVVPVLRYQDAGTPGANQSNHSIGRILSMSTRERRNQLVPGSVS